MDITEIIIKYISPEGYIQALQLLVVVGIVVYALFAFLIMRSVRLMNKSFRTEAALLFRLIAIAHFLSVILLLILSYIIL